MTPRKRARAPNPAAAFRPGQLLDWHDSRHWNWAGPAPCRYCGRDAFLLDSGRHPAHKTCAEAALAQQQAEAADAYQTGHLDT